MTSVNNSLDLNGVVVEHHFLKRGELPEHTIIDHRLAITLGERPIPFEHKENGRWKPVTLTPGSFNMQNHGDIGIPRWSEDYQFLAVAIKPEFYKKMLPDVSPDRLEFITQRGTIDTNIDLFSNLFQNELSKGGTSGKLYTDTLGVAFATYLLNRYANGGQRIKRPKGRLFGVQTKNILDYVMSNLHKDISLGSLSGIVHQSPFHFAKTFKDTTGLSPYQFVLKVRFEKALELIRSKRSGLTEIAHSIGFYDQSHFTNSFKRFYGMTPKQFYRSI
ncbi:MAG: helix-turn-helix transcriptional regulator [Leptolyngbya sp. SIO3F4]|nr:helix-turn-helix transcriptional regulator [Leptolyngbya sp. SIO3F4]